MSEVLGQGVQFYRGRNTVTIWKTAARFRRELEKKVRSGLNEFISSCKVVPVWLKVSVKQHERSRHISSSKITIMPRSFDRHGQ